MDGIGTESSISGLITRWFVQKNKNTEEMAGFFGTQETKTDSLLVSLDLGSHKIKALAAIEKKDGSKSILGLEEIESDGIKRGVIINPARVTSLVRKLISRLEKKIDRHIAKVYVSTGGINLEVEHNSVYRRTDGRKQFSAALIEEMEEENQRLFNDADTEILLIEPQGFKIDDEIDENEPVGSVGSKIDGKYLIIAARKSDVDILRRTLKNAGLDSEIYPSAYVCATGVVSKKEMEVGAVVLDMGAGVSQLSLFHNGHLAHVAVVPFAGNSITNDLKKGWNIQQDQAEKLKCKYGSALPSMEKEDHFVSLTGVRNWSDKMVQNKVLAFVMEARLEEMFAIFANQIESSQYYDSLGTGIVLTGGSSRIKNLMPFVKKNTGLDACVSQPVVKYNGKGAANLHKPEYAVLLGLLNEIDEDCEKKEGFGFFNKSAPKRPAQTRKKPSAKDITKGFTGSLFEHPKDVSF